MVQLPITICIPTFNDYESLAHLLSEFKLEKLPIRVLVIDNGSEDSRVLEVLNEFKSEDIDFKRVPKNLGFGGAIKFAARHSNTEYFGWMPGNLKIRPKELNEFINTNYPFDVPVIKAKRINRDLLSRLKTNIFGIVHSVLTGKNLMDSGGTPTILHRNFLDLIAEAPDDYVFESYFLYQARLRKLKIVRPGISYSKRLYGVSHWQNGIKSEWKLLFNVLNKTIYWRLHFLKASGSVQSKFSQNKIQNF